MAAVTLNSVLRQSCRRFLLALALFDRRSPAAGTGHEAEGNGSRWAVTGTSAGPPDDHARTLPHGPENRQVQPVR